MSHEAHLGPSSVSRSALGRLYHGESSFDFVGRWKVWLALSGAVLLAGMVSLLARGLNLGIEFVGGAVWEVPAAEASVEDAREALEPLGLGGATIQILESDSGRAMRVETDQAEVGNQGVTQALAEVAGVQPEDVDSTQVGASWGKDITEKAVRALVVFLVLVTIYIGVRFDTKMALPTLAALLHDLGITVGVYSLAGLPVTPATVIAVLTILGYSMYDGIVVFDKVEENTRLVSAAGGMTYGAMVNLSLNQMLMRSLNTSITSLLPIASLLVVGSWVLGASTLEEFALALLVGLGAGAYSSIFIASPMVAWLKEREPRYAEVKRKLEVRGGSLRSAKGTVVAGSNGSNGSTVAGPSGLGPGGARVIPPRPRKKGRRR